MNWSRKAEKSRRHFPLEDDTAFKINLMKEHWQRLVDVKRLVSELGLLEAPCERNGKFRNGFLEFYLHVCSCVCVREKKVSERGGARVWSFADRNA